MEHKNNKNIDYNKLMHLIESNKIPYSMENQSIIISLGDIQTEEKPESEESDTLARTEARAIISGRTDPSDTPKTAPETSNSKVDGSELSEPENTVPSENNNLDIEDEPNDLD